jgi:hypothetical protein
MHRETFIAKFTEIQQNVGQLLAQLQASEHDKFSAHLYRSRREFHSACDHAGKSGKQIERCVISTFRVAESMGFKGEFRQWQRLLRIDDWAFKPHLLLSSGGSSEARQSSHPSPQAPTLRG